jgi:hypothetical protein
MARSQVFPAALSQPDQPEKVAPPAGVAVSLTAAPIVREAEQTFPFAPQLIPPTSLVTVPFPAVATERVKVFSVNVAVTDRAASIVTVQFPVPVQAPDHPVKLELADGAAVNVTGVPKLKEAEQVAPQLIPAGLLVTVPPPFPVFATERANTFNVKVAVTVFAVLIVTVQEVPETLSQPDQPVKSESAEGRGERVTTVPLL